jgi:hypothetical protein
VVAANQGRSRRGAAQPDGLPPLEDA